ncbi:MAG: hypothetical protein KAH31_01405 [Candidatus Sabulitectum sp.]|nr:hypothetical protein [Candidatus Sabulitectum sp.]
MKKLVPGVTRDFLMLLAGYTWVCVGFMLIYRAYSWLSAAPEVNGLIYAGGGIMIALLIHHFGFLKIVNKNLQRIHNLEEKALVTSFLQKKSYLLILVMIAMGIFLRSSGIPKHYLATLYIGIGAALILSSLRYFRISITGFRNSIPGE